MGRHGLNSIKPGVNRRVHLFAAALLWTAVGAFLMAKGLSWIGPADQIRFVPAALAIGTIKSLLVLDRTARRIVERIRNMRDGTCLGAVYSWKTWLLVVCMISSGILLRTVFVPGNYIGALYCAIGWALFLSSRTGWKEWFRRQAND